MYLFLPIVSIGIKTVMKIETRFIVIPFVITLVILFASNDMNAILKLSHPWDIQSIIFVDWSGGDGVYIITGYLLEKVCLKNKKINLLFLFNIVVIIGTSLYMLYCYSRGETLNPFSNNNSILQWFLLCNIFLLFKGTADYENLLVRFFSRYSFTVYLFHWPVIHILNHVLVSKIGLGTSYVVILYVLTVAVTVVLSVMIPKNKTIYKYVLHMK